MKSLNAPRTLAALALIAALPAALAATPVQIKFGGQDLAGNLLTTYDAAVSSVTPVTNNAPTAGLNYTYVASGDSFIAYCLEPNQGNGRAGVIRTYEASAFTGTKAPLVQGLFSKFYGGLSDYDSKAAFQLALWEIMRETGSPTDVTSGGFYMSASGTNFSTVASIANNYLTQAATYSGPSLYTLTYLSNASLQDLVTATPVPEPMSGAMLMSGLAVLGLLARRRFPR